jgi:hypothetical protein
MPAGLRLSVPDRWKSVSQHRVSVGTTGAFLFLRIRLSYAQRPFIKCPLSELVAMLKKEVRRYLAELGRKGGKAAAQKLTQEQRREKGRKAVQARWAKKKEKR